jgi:hypothetical protein
MGKHNDARYFLSKCNKGSNYMPGKLGTSAAGRSQAFKDMFVLILLCAIVLWLSTTFDEFGRILSWVYRHDDRRIDEFFSVTLFALFGIAVYAWRRHQELVEQIRKRKEAEQERNLLIPELDNALADAQLLRSLLPICGACKKIRDDRGYWSQVEIYIEAKLNTKLTHGLCPECARDLYRSTGRRTHALR